MLAAACVCSLKCTAWIGVPSYPTGEGTGRPAGISRVREKRENPRSGEIDVVRRARQLEEQAVSVAHWPAEQSSPETESPSGSRERASTPRRPCSTPRARAPEAIEATATRTRAGRGHPLSKGIHTRAVG